jgi:hypothetical protein
MNLFSYSMSRFRITIRRPALVGISLLFSIRPGALLRCRLKNITKACLRLIPKYSRLCCLTSDSFFLSLLLYSLLDLGRFFTFLIPHTVGRTPWTGISQSQGRYLHTEQHKHRINAHRHPCLEWDLNPPSRCSSERGQFMPPTARPL